MAAHIEPFLMFQGGIAEKAMRFYMSLFADGKIVELEHYGAGEQGPEGTVKRARFTIAGQTIRCIDSPIAHGFDFTPSISLFVECESEEQILALNTQLTEGGKVLMLLASYGFSRHFTWLEDRFGVSWQLNLA